MSSSAPPSRSRLTRSGSRRSAQIMMPTWPKGVRNTGVFGPRRVANQLVIQLVLAILADEFSFRIEEDGRVVAAVAVGFEHTGHQVDIEAIGQSGQTPIILAVWNLLAERPIVVERNCLVLNGITIQKALGRTHELRPAAGGRGDQLLGTRVVRLFLGPQPFEHDAGHSHVLCRARGVYFRCGRTDRLAGRSRRCCRRDRDQQNGCDQGVPTMPTGARIELDAIHGISPLV